MMEYDKILKILKQEMAAAMGCTEPVAIAYASAKARAVLGRKPDRARVNVSCNILKNAMGVGGGPGNGGCAGYHWRRQ